MSGADIVWAVQGFYFERYGWETVTHCDGLSDARDMAACYRENEPGVPFRVRVVSRAVLS